MSQVWLVGEQNPYGSDPTYALYPLPERSAGGRLCAVLQMQRTEYLRTFERANLLDLPRWSAPAARASAALLVGRLGAGDRLVLLGAKVSAAFGLTFRSALWTLRERPVSATAVHEVCVLPHPSGMSREWNAPHAATWARICVAAVLRRPCPSCGVEHGKCGHQPLRGPA